MKNRLGRWFARFAMESRPRAGASAKAGARRRPLTLELLEHRIVPAVFKVNSTADILFPPVGIVTLRSAINEANHTPGGNIIELTVPGDYKITIPPKSPDDTPATENDATGDFDILPGGGNLTIENTSGGTVIVDGNHLDRVFDINPNAFAGGASTPPFTVTLKGFTIDNGIASPGDGPTGTGGGIRDQGNASLTLDNMVIAHNRATADGGGVSMENASSTPWALMINNSTISDNHAGDAGGGVETDGTGFVSINPGTVISNNTCINQGAGVYLDMIQVGSVLQSATLNITGTLISGNSALSTTGGFGGGICNAGNGKVTLTQSTIDHNFAGATGGGFSDQMNQGSLIVLRCLISGNSAVGDGGGIAEGNGTTIIRQSEIRNNSTAANGGGVFIAGTALRMAATTVANNTASGNGDGTGGGGGIELETTGKGKNASEIINSTITQNTALNNAGANGGGIDAATTFTGDLFLLNDTINNNFASNGGAIFWTGTAGSAIKAQNTIIAKNFVSNGGAGPDANNVAGTFTDIGGNLIGVAGAGSGNTGFTASTTQKGTVAHPLDPLLGILTDNGGPKVGAPGFAITLQTEAPLSGSPAIGKGILPGIVATDERGFPSVVNGKVNVGAVSQAPDDSGSVSASSVTVGGILALAQQLDGFFVNDSDPTTKHRMI
jgi:fibronectin-binding autotransporter adhesin